MERGLEAGAIGLGVAVAVLAVAIAVAAIVEWIGARRRGGKGVLE